MQKEAFTQLVQNTVTSLPKQAVVVLKNVAFVVEDEARREKASEVGIKMNEVLLGLYEGIPKTQRGSGYFGVLPDKITIFQKPIEKLASFDEKRLKKLVYEVVYHEIGHHFGFGEKELRNIEAQKRKKDCV
ncbi:metallopeptidase family protein [Patescibacteria group bacterium]|nr:metallopeptidase family protein [Patescibacteria group bacterium]MBU1246769.1 metallopeptidase family protein [Patescibacteria group bacterium]MBU1519379.1 metallopeptidase family protein [Patescibacteria group bacterium]MBU1730612.1 metallopeptidase family protein [Patescibacteria group bacterium]MBU2009987.1 metallopeptidase family protein [Patescibacteria group bacterium]